MSVDIVDVRRCDAGGLASQGHRGQRRIPIGMGLGEMVLVNGGAIADEFAKNGGASSARVVERLQGKHCRALADGKPIAASVEGAAGGR